MSLYFEQQDQEGLAASRRPIRVDAAVQWRDVNDGNAGFVFAPFGYDPAQPQPNAPRFGQRQGILPAGDSGTQARFNNDPLTIAPVWQTTPQEWQPPAIRYSLKSAGLMRADIVSRAEFGPAILPFAGGWDIQPIQPPAPFSIRSSPFVLLAAATARGDDGIGGILIPPWAFAKPLTTFPDIQSNVAAAIPSYNAGPQVGAIKSQPGIAVPTVLKATPGTIFTVIVNTAGTGAGAIYDASSVAAASSANQICGIPSTANTIVLLEWPCQNGIVLIPGAGQILAAKLV
jgi:hypothetical protein